MKLRDVQTELNELRKTVVWPQFNPSFDSFQKKLRNVVDANFGAEAAQSLTYCMDTNLFGFVIQVDGLLSGPLSTNCPDDDKRTGCALRRLVSIDPTGAITTQMNEIANVHARLQQRHTLLQSLLNAHLGSQQ